MRLEPQLFSGQNTDDTNITKKVYNGSHKDVFCRPQTLSYMAKRTCQRLDVSIYKKIKIQSNILTQKTQSNVWRSKVTLHTEPEDCEK
jgi:hypothetical protein